MGALIIFAVVITAIAVFDILAVRFGVDSRVDSLDPRHPARGAAIS
jgi:hypothetical protein